MSAVTNADLLAALTTLDKRLGAVERKVGLTADLTAGAPAKSTRKASTRKTAKKAATRKPRPTGKSHQTKAQLGRKGWNSTFSTLVRTSGLRFGSEQVSLYRVSQNRWDTVTEVRDNGGTPAEAVNALVSAANKGVLA